MTDAQQPADATQPPEGRRFGYWAGHFVVVGSMIGAGILTTSGEVLRKTGNPSALLGLWALGGILALCGAVTVAEMATTLPHSGGDYVFVREAFGRGAGFVSGWGTFVLGFAGPTAVVAHLALAYLTAPYSSLLAENLPPWVVAHLIPLGASGVILVIGLTHILGHRHSTWLQTAATIVTGCMLFAIAFGGILFGSGDWDHLSASRLPPLTQWPVLAGMLAYIGYSYAGWNAAAYLAGEIHNPTRTLPRCLIGGTITQTPNTPNTNLVCWVCLVGLFMTEKTKKEVEPVADLAVRALFGPSAARVVGASLSLCLVATVSAFLLTGPRVAYAMARDGVFPGFAAHLHRQRGTPVAATLTLTAAAAALVWVGSLPELLDFTSVGLVALTGLTVASVFPLRRRADLPHPYRLPLYPLPPLAFLALMVLTIGSALSEEENRVPRILSLATVLVGIPLSRLLPQKQDERGGTLPEVREKVTR